MDPNRPSVIHVLHDTGYRLAPGNIQIDLIEMPGPPVPEGHVAAGVRVRAEGKTYVWATVPAEVNLLTEWALAWSVRIWSYVDESEFRRLAALARIPERDVETALSSIQIHDDCYFRRPRSLEVTPAKMAGWDEEH